MDGRFDLGTTLNWIRRELVSLSKKYLPVERIPEPWRGLVPWLFPAPRILMVRSEDLVVLGLELNGLSIVEEGAGDNRSAVLRPSGGRDGLLIVHFQPQNIAEEAFFEFDADYRPKRPPEPSGAMPKPDPDDPTNPLPHPDQSPPSEERRPVSTLIAGPSRLVFRVPKEGDAIEYTIDGILDAIRRLDLVVALAALPPQDPPPHFWKPVWLVAVEDALARPAEGVGISAPRDLARIQRWEDRSDLVPITMVGGQNLVGVDAIEPDDFGVVRVAKAERLADAGLLVRGFPRLSVTELSPELVAEVVELIRVHPPLYPPKETETALELPFRLLVSPNQHAAWAHAHQPVFSQHGAAELWHTRMASRSEKGGVRVVDETDPRLRTIRAVWARSGPTPAERFSKDRTDRPGHSNKPFRMSLDPADRFDIVHESANFNIDGYQPEPVRVDALMLTSLGAWIDTRGQWDPPTADFEVEEWRHRGTMARDHYVRVVYKGYLWPFGHRASLIKVTERKFHPPMEPPLSGGPAILRQRMFIIVRQPVLKFGDPQLTTADGAHLDHQFPFTRVEITTLTTPNLDPPENSDYPQGSVPANLFPQGSMQSLFWPRVGGKDVPFHIAAEDLEAHRLEFTAPLLFVSNTEAHSAAHLEPIKTDYEKSDLAEVDLAGQRLAMAESEREGDTTFETQKLELGVELPTDAAMARLEGDRPRFYPRIRRAHIVVPVIKQYTGAAAPTIVGYTETFLKDGLPNASDPDVNPGQVFLKITGQGPSLNFSGGGDKVGAFAQPNIAVTGISRVMGPIGGNLDALAGGTFDPTQFFAEAKLFGVIDLGNLIGEVTGLAGAQPKELVPKFVTESCAAVDAFLNDLERLNAEVERLKQSATGASAAVLTQIDTVENDLTADIGAINTSISGFLSGPGDPVALEAALNSLHDHLNAAAAVVDGLPTEVPSEARRATKATVGAFLADLATDIGGVAGFLQRLTNALQLAEELTMRFDWRPILHHWPHKDDATKSIFRAVNSKSGDKATFVIAAELQAKTELRPQPRLDVSARLHNFTLNLIGEQPFLLLHFNKLEFAAHAGIKPDVNVEFDDIEFTGVLSFVEDLRTLIPLGGFSDPPALDVSEQGIKASFSMALPDIAVGVFSLQNLSLGAGFTVPFLIDPLSVRFNFCERESPFLLTVSMFGGGGFFAITLDPGGVQILEASFEFGASLSLNLGVASGGVTVMAGIYYKMEIDEATLTGYFRLRGEVDVLGLISASIELYLGLSYEFASGKCVGRAAITVEIEIAFFSTSVSITHERKFSGSNGDPTFAELMAPGPDVEGDPWAEYCEAFA